MPITPLHFGLLPVLNRVTKRKIDAAGFVLTNVLADIPVIIMLIESENIKQGAPSIGLTLHGVATHTFPGALALGLILGALWFKWPGWMLGCLLGALTHVALDMFVHSDVAPFAPFTQWNPFYFEWAHGAFSIILAIGLGIWILECLGQMKEHRQKIVSALEAPRPDQS